MISGSVKRAGDCSPYCTGSQQQRSDPGAFFQKSSDGILRVCGALRGYFLFPDRDGQLRLSMVVGDYCYRELSGPFAEWWFAPYLVALAF
jgi:hypothetical protein